LRPWNPGAKKRRRSPALPWPQPIGDGRWTDDDGIDWHLRGRRSGRAILVSGPTLRRLLKRADPRVLHAYGPRPVEVDGPERDALMARVDQYFAGEAPPHNGFLLAEFRDGDRRVMLVVEEFC
jgi:hypothetical protein